MITVEEAEHIILGQVADHGTETVPFQDAVGRVLAEDIAADRDIPASDRATMDGIAIRFSEFQKGVRSFKIKAMQAAGDAPVELTDNNTCVEIMTGAALSASVDTVVRYEDIRISEGAATVQIEAIKQGQNIHRKGADRKPGDIIVPVHAVVSPAVIGAAAFTGRETLLVKKKPRIIVISNGDELVDVSDTPPAYKIRRSNSYTIKAALQQCSLDADLLHLPDDEKIIETKLADCLASYDVLILSGGVSMGKYDLLPQALEKRSVQKLFHKVQQKPGKPFWFGTHPQGARVFAFPGNPVSTFMCFYRYFIPWYRACMGLKEEMLYAVLSADYHFQAPLQYFLQVKLHVNEAAQLIATPVKGNGSGDLANLTDADAFMELPLKLDIFKKGDTFRVWPFNSFLI
jgi:molybdopterin molybdotransferase